MCDETGIIRTIHYIFLVTCSISVFSCLCIIIIYYLHKDYRGISLKIVLCMSITDLVSSLFYYIPENYLKNSSVCQFAAVVTNLCLKLDVIWSMCIVCTLKEVLSNPVFKPDNHLKKWFFYAFLVLPIFQSLPLITDSFGDNFGVCSYKNDLKGIIWRLVGDFFIFFGLAYTVFGYFKIHLKVKEFNLFGIRQLIFDNGLIYSFILIVIIIPAVLLRYIEYFQTFCDVYYYSYIAYILFSLQGFLNFCALLSNHNIRRSIKMILNQTHSFNETEYITDILNQSTESEKIQQP